MRSMSMNVLHRGAPALVAVFAACTDTPTAVQEATPAELLTDSRGSRDRVQCSADNGGITLPRGFCAVVVADLVVDGQPAAARHMAVTPTGDIFVAINSPRNNQPSTGIIGLRDRNGDGRADEESRFSPGLGGSGIAWGNGSLFFGANDRVLRYRLPAGRLAPVGNPETVVSGLPNTGDHISKTVVLTDRRTLFAFVALLAALSLLSEIRVSM